MTDNPTLGHLYVTGVSALALGWQGATPLWAALGSSPPSKSVCVVYLYFGSCSVAQTRCASPLVAVLDRLVPDGVHFFGCRRAACLNHHHDQSRIRQRQRELSCACASSSLQGKRLISVPLFVLVCPRNYYWLRSTTSLVPSKTSAWHKREDPCADFQPGATNNKRSNHGHVLCPLQTLHYPLCLGGRGRVVQWMRMGVCCGLAPACRFFFQYRVLYTVATLWTPFS